MSTRRTGIAAAAAVAIVLTLTAQPAGARTVHTVLEDDSFSLFSPRALPSFMSRLRWLGVDYLRISAEWKLEAPAPNSPAPPAHFDAQDPRTYRSPGIEMLDRAVRAASAAGLGVIVDPAFSAPLWATTDTAAPSSPGDPWYRTNINVRKLVAWEVMLARRYSGSFTPPGAQTPLPRVSAFTLWNEPNGPAYLQPQWQGTTPVSADWYRTLVDLAYPAIKRVSPNAVVLIGNTSDDGGTPGSGGVPPLDFIRRLACVDSRLRPIGSGACAHFHAVPGDGFAHHPYERGAPPWMPSTAGESGWSQMGDLPQLQALLDSLVALHRLAPGVRSLWLTEQGYESNGQLTDKPWSETQQAQLNAVSEYLAWRDPRLVSFAQFLLRDTGTDASLVLRHKTGNAHAQVAGAWTTGLVRDGVGFKPSLWMFRSPVVARILAPARPACLATASTPVPTELVEVWGRARPVHGPAMVRVEVRRATGGPFRVIARLRTDSNGVFDVALPVPAGTRVRFRWLQGNSWQDSPGTTPIAFRVPSWRE